MTTSQKPPGCRINCGGSLPPLPAHAPHTRMLYNCGLARFGNCPAVKSIGQARQKRRRHRFGLWRRSRREHRRSAEAMVIVLEFPDSADTYPEGTVDRIRQRAEQISFDQTLYATLRQHGSIPEALDQYLNAILPFTPKALMQPHRNGSCPTYESSPSPC